MELASEQLNDDSMVDSEYQRIGSILLAYASSDETLTQIARRHSVTERQLYRIVRRYGFPPRREIQQKQARHSY